MKVAGRRANDFNIRTYHVLMKVAGLRRFARTSSVGRALAVEAALAAGEGAAELAARPAAEVLAWEEGFDFGALTVAEVRRDTPRDRPQPFRAVFPPECTGQPASCYPLA